MKNFKINLECPHRIKETGIITNQIAKQIIKSDLVIADLTGANPNVYYELAIRHTIEKPSIQIIDSKQLPNLPFDIKSLRTIDYNISDEKNVSKFRDDLTETIQIIVESLDNFFYESKVPLPGLFSKYRKFLPISKDGFHIADMDSAPEYWDDCVDTFYAWNPSWQTELRTQPDKWMKIHYNRYLKNDKLKRVIYVIGHGKNRPGNEWQYFYLRGFKKFLKELFKKYPEIKPYVKEKMEVYEIEEDLESEVTFFIGCKRRKENKIGLFFINERPFMESSCPIVALITRYERIIDEMVQMFNGVMSKYNKSDILELL